MMALKSIYGFEGYGIFVSIKAYLREQEGYKVKVDSKYGYAALLGAIGLQWEPDKFKEFCEDCAKEFEVLSIKNGVLSCPELTESMVLWDKKRTSGRKGGIAKAKQNPSTPPSTPPSKTLASNRTEQNRTEQNRIEESLSPAPAPEQDKKIPPQISELSEDEIIDLLSAQTIWMDQLKMKRKKVDFAVALERYACHLVKKGENVGVSLNQYKAGFRGWVMSSFAEAQPKPDKANEIKSDFKWCDIPDYRNE